MNLLITVQRISRTSAIYLSDTASWGKVRENRECRKVSEFLEIWNSRDEMKWRCKNAIWRFYCLKRGRNERNGNGESRERWTLMPVAYLLWMMRVNRVTVLPLTAFTRATERVSADVAFFRLLVSCLFHIESFHR